MGIEKVLSLCFIAPLVSSVASAFTLTYNGSGVIAAGWNPSSVTFDLDTTCTNYLSTVSKGIEAASRTWGKVPTSSLSIAQGNTVSLPNPITTYVGNSATQYAPIGNPIVYCDTNFQSDSGQSANSTLGFATGQNIAADGTIQGCLLVLNVQPGGTANVATLSETSVANVMTHEIGHCLGFGHSADTNAMMYYATTASRQLVLSKDDMDAATFLYPKHEAGSSLPGCASTIDQSRKGPWIDGGTLKSRALSFLLADFTQVVIISVLLVILAQLSARNKKAYSSATS